LKCSSFSVAVKRSRVSTNSAMRWPTPRRISSVGQETPGSVGGTWVSSSFGFQKSRPLGEDGGGAALGSGAVEGVKLSAGTTDRTEGAEGALSGDGANTRSSGAVCSVEPSFGFIGMYRDFWRGPPSILKLTVRTVYPGAPTTATYLPELTPENMNSPGASADIPSSSLPSSGETRTVAGPRKGDSSSSRKQILSTAAPGTDLESSNAVAGAVCAERLVAESCAVRRNPVSRTQFISRDLYASAGAVTAVHNAWR